MEIKDTLYMRAARGEKTERMPIVIEIQMLV